MQYVRSLIQQLQKGFSQRRIARELQLSRNTVKEYSNRLFQSTYSLRELQQMDDAALAAIMYAHAKQSQADPRREDFKLRISYFTAELKRTVSPASYFGKNINRLIRMVMSIHNFVSFLPCTIKLQMHLCIFLISLQP